MPHSPKVLLGLIATVLAVALGIALTVPALPAPSLSASPGTAVVVISPGSRDNLPDGIRR